MGPDHDVDWQWTCLAKLFDQLRICQPGCEESAATRALISFRSLDGFVEKTCVGFPLVLQKQICAGVDEEWDIRFISRFSDG